jgi:cobalt-zinc-cadmium efflux system outer membrane protein
LLRQQTFDIRPVPGVPVARFGQASAAGEAQAGHQQPSILPASSQQSGGLAATLDELIGIAIANHPEVRAAHARVESARGKMIQAGLYPNLIMGPNLGETGDRVNHIGEGGARFIQTFVTAGKLRIAKQAAAHGVEAADWQAVTKWHDTVLRVRLAYYELLTAQREQDTMADIVRVSDEAFKATTALEKAGAAKRPDVLRARVELEQNVLKKAVSARRVEAAWQNLDTMLGRPGLDLKRRSLDRKALEDTPPDYEWSALLTCLQDTSSLLHEARALVAQQEKLLAKARADVTPNVDVQFNPFYAADPREFRAQIIVTAPVPIFDRNQGNIHSAQSELARSIADEKNLELQLTEKLTLGFQRYQAARQQVKAYRDAIVRDATESLDLIRKGFGGDQKYDYTAVLQAQQILFQTQLAQTQAMGELWRAAVEIAWLLQQDHLAPSCGANR